MGRPAQRLCFPRASRLKSGRDFSRVREQGKRLAVGGIIANWLNVPGDGQPRLGVVTSRKVGNAVERNRARRLLREAFRLHQAEFTGNVDLVLVARPSIAGKDFIQVERDFLTTMRKAGLFK